MTQSKINLTQPAIGAPNWGPTLNSNFGLIDKSFSTIGSAIALTTRETALSVSDAQFGVVSVSGDIANFTYVDTGATIRPYAILTIPADVVGFWGIYNATTCSLATTSSVYRQFGVKYPGQADVNSVICKRGFITYVNGNGSTMQYADYGMSCQITPAGTISPFSNTQAFQPPTFGWILCNGAQYLQSSFPDLYGAIRNSYGTATAGYFRVPNIPNLTITPGTAGVSSIPYFIKT